MLSLLYLKLCLWYTVSLFHTILLLFSYLPSQFLLTYFMFDAVGYSAYAAHLSYQSTVLYILIGLSLDICIKACVARHIYSQHQLHL